MLCELYILIPVILVLVVTLLSMVNTLLTVPDGISFAPFVHGWCDLPLLENLFISHKGGSSRFFSSSKPTTRMLALSFDFSMSISNLSDLFSSNCKVTHGYVFYFSYVMQYHQTYLTLAV